MIIKEEIRWETLDDIWFDGDEGRNSFQFSINRDSAISFFFSFCVCQMKGENDLGEERKVSMELILWLFDEVSLRCRWCRSMWTRRWMKGRKENVVAGDDESRLTCGVTNQHWWTVSTNSMKEVKKENAMKMKIFENEWKFRSKRIFVENVDRSDDWWKNERNAMIIVEKRMKFVFFLLHVAVECWLLFFSSVFSFSLLLCFCRWRWCRSLSLALTLIPLEMKKKRMFLFRSMWFDGVHREIMLQKKSLIESLFQDYETKTSRFNVDLNDEFQCRSFNAKTFSFSKWIQCWNSIRWWKMVRWKRRDWSSLLVEILGIQVLLFNVKRRNISSKSINNNIGQISI